MSGISAQKEKGKKEVCKKQEKQMCKILILNPGGRGFSLKTIEKPTIKITDQVRNTHVPLTFILTSPDQPVKPAASLGPH